MGIFKTARTHTGFTLVELLVVIVVIGILTTIGIVSYRGVQQRAVVAAAKADLAKVSDEFKLAYAEDALYPTTLPTNITTSPGITLELVQSTLPYYGNLSDVQQGVLFQEVCSALVSEGYGVGVNNGGGTEQYVTGCYVYGYEQLHINGWNSKHFSVPIGRTTVHNWYDSNISYNSYRPNQKKVVLAFADELSYRYEAMGGNFPVTTFWDPWASPGNGVQKENLPTPSAGEPGISYCVQATSTKYPSIIWHASPGNAAAEGACS